MKRLRWPIAIVLLMVALFTTDSLLYRRTVPPSTVTDIHSFLEWRPQTEQFTVVPGIAGEHLMATGDSSGIMPSGPSAYIFDNHGRLVDRSSDIGDDTPFDERWQAQHIRGSGKIIPRSEIDHWLSSATQTAP